MAKETYEIKSWPPAGIQFEWKSISGWTYEQQEVEAKALYTAGYLEYERVCEKEEARLGRFLTEGESNKISDSLNPQLIADLEAIGCSMRRGIGVTREEKLFVWGALLGMMIFIVLPVAVVLSLLIWWML